MVLDNLNNSSKYDQLHPLFKRAFEFLKNFDPQKNPNGKHTIEGDQLFALISDHDDYVPNTKLEAHKRYIDIQYVYKGLDMIGWKETGNCTMPLAGFDTEKDFILYNDQPLFIFKLDANCFTVLWPDDAHAPLMGTAKMIKVVVKVEL